MTKARRRFKNTYQAVALQKGQNQTKPPLLRFFINTNRLIPILPTWGQFLVVDALWSSADGPPACHVGPTPILCVCVFIFNYHFPIKSALRDGSEKVLHFKQALHASIAKEPALGLKNWFKSDTGSLCIVVASLCYLKPIIFMWRNPRISFRPLILFLFSWCSLLLVLHWFKVGFKWRLCVKVAHINCKYIQHICLYTHLPFQVTVLLQQSQPLCMVVGEVFSNFSFPSFLLYTHCLAVDCYRLSLPSSNSTHLNHQLCFRGNRSLFI